MLAAAIEAARGWKLRAAIGADGSCLERVEGLPTLAALPVFAGRWSRVAGRTGVAGTAREFLHLRKRLRVFETAPAVHPHINRD